MAVADFRWGALRLLLQARASLAGGASEPADQARFAARGHRGKGGCRSGLEAREGVAAWGVAAWRVGRRRKKGEEKIEKEKRRIEKKKRRKGKRK
jgi:hypothetical protein